MVAEPTLECYIYYLRWVARDSRQDVQNRRTAFEGELRSLLTHLGRLSGKNIPTWAWPEESQDRHISQLIMRTSWLDNPATGRSCFVEARTYGDVYWLHVGYSQNGQAGSEVFASLRDDAWQPSAAEYLLGNSSYLCGIAGDDVDDLATQTLTRYTGAVTQGIVSTRRADGCAWLYGWPEQPYTVALFYPDADCEAWASRHLLNDSALRLELYRHKVDRQLAWCEHNGVALREQEHYLRDLVEQFEGMPPDDTESLRRLVRLYRVYDANVGILAERETTIAITWITWIRSFRNCSHWLRIASWVQHETDYDSAISSSRPISNSPTKLGSRPTLLSMP